METKKIPLMIENHSVSGKDYRAKGVHVYIPGLAVNLRVEVPETAVDRLIEELKKTAPAIKVSIGKPVKQVDAPEKDNGALDEEIDTKSKPTNKPRKKAGGKKR
jgi:hypothetical protein